MKKFLETSFGSRGVDTSQPIRTAFDNLFAIYDDFQRLMETSAYTTVDKNGRKIRVLFPVSIKVTTFEKLTDRFKQQRHYQSLQQSSMEENPNYKAKYFSFPKEVSWDIQKIMDYADKHCWPNSINDQTVKNITEKVNFVP